MQIFNFLVLSVIIAYRSVLTPHICKTHLPIHLTFLNSKWRDAQKRPVMEHGSTLCVGMEYPSVKP